VFDGKLPVGVMRGYTIQAYLWKDLNEHQERSSDIE
jgi:hypothetical protein